MPPPLAVIWRTWPQILSPFTIWAVLSWLQGGFSFRLIPPSSPVACQVRLTVACSSPSIYNFSGLQIVSYYCVYARFVVSLPWLCALCCHFTVVMRTLLSFYRGYAHFVVILPWLCALCCQIIIAIHILYIIGVRLINTILSIL